ncbi:MAG: VCBS repeat-containing protein [Lentisphaeria bacterium]|nr:VCBS repeat-containing protein [Lentisphaeria bacterium]
MKRIFLSSVVLFTMLAMGTVFAADFSAAPDISLADVGYPYSLSFGDLNGDGRPDLVISSWGKRAKGKDYDHSQSRVLVFQQKKGGFSQPPDRAFNITAPWTVRIRDLDGDGANDIAVAETRRKLHLFLAAEDFAVDHLNVDINHGDRSLAVANLGDDDKMDLLCGASWRRWLGDDTFRNGYFYGPETNDNRAVSCHDINRDGHPDAVFLGGGGVRIYCGPFPVSTVKPDEISQLITITPPDPAVNYVVADFNADGRPDLAISVRPAKGTNRSPRILLYFQQAPMGFPAGDTPSQEITGVHGPLYSADVNRDGRQDLLVCAQQARKVLIFRQKKGGGFATQVEGADQVLKGGGSYCLAIGDVDADGFPDLAVSDGSRRVHIFRNLGQQEEERKLAQHGRMPYYTGAVLPTPQQADYRDEYIPIGGASLLVGPATDATGPHAQFLRARIRSVGGSLNLVDSLDKAGPVCVVLGNSPDCAALLVKHPVPTREQGYTLNTIVTGKRTLVVLRGHDRLGLLWAISTFSQLLHMREGKAVVRAADIRDYPVVQNRGFIAGNWADGAYYSIAFKFNKPVFQNGLVPRGISRKERYTCWRKPIPEILANDVKAMGELLTPFGIEWYAGFNPIVGKPEEKIHSGNDEDFQAAFRLSCLVAEAGGHLCLKYDDNRFPINPADKTRFGTAREADIYFVNRLFAAVRERYPTFKILFCPPFYWGPTSAALYPEPRDDYLFALGKRLPKDVEIFWTGPSVKSGIMKPEYVQWITERLQRRPVFWQNAFGMPHSYGYHYATDPVATWRDWYYDGFYEQVDTYMLNSMMPNYCAANATASDYCWNPNSYDPEASIAQACSKLVGDDTYAVLIRLNQALGWFDKFGLRQTPAAARALPEMAKNLEAVNEVWSDVKTTNLAAVQRWTGMEGHVKQVNTFYRRLKRNPKLSAFAKPAAQSRQHAEREIGLNPKTDTFIAAVEFVGGMGPTVYGNRCEKRLATWIYGSQSANPRMEVRFEIDPFPAAGDYELIVSAQDDDAEKKCHIRIKLNDTVVFEGENPFVRLGWSRHTFRLPANQLKRQNKLLIENPEPTGRSGGPPFFMLNYMVLRKTAK